MDIKIQNKSGNQIQKTAGLNLRQSSRFAHYAIPILYIFGDIGGIFASFVIAYQLRFESGLAGIIPIVHGIPQFSTYLYAVIFVAAVWIFIFSLFGQYRRRSPSIFDRFYEIIRGVTSGTFFVLATTFFYRGDSFSRLVLGLAWVVAIALIWAIRELIYRLERYYLKMGALSKRAIFVGENTRGLELYNKLATQPAWAIIPIGFVCEYEDSFSNLGSDAPPCLGKIENLEDIVKANSVELIVFNLLENRQDFIADFVMKSEILGLEYMISPDILGMMTFNSEAGHIQGIPVLRWGKTAIEGYPRVIKRIFDMVFSLMGLILISPLLTAIAAAIKIDSQGPVLFRQRRVGRNGIEFAMLKFRSMKTNDNNSNGSGWTIKDDPRRTKIGAFIRKYNLDELPQLFNVLRGQMSLVGPRPEQPDYVEKFKDDVPRYFQRHRVKSGMTGWAQVNGLRGDTSISERTKYDMYYVENWSLIFDIKIILLTLRNFLKSPNAY